MQLARRMAAERFRLSGFPAIEVTLRRSPRARRLSLRVSGLDGRVTLTIPRRASAAEARAFAEERGDWIRTARARAPAKLRVLEGAMLPVEGREVTVAAGRPSGVTSTRLVLSRPTGPAAAALLKILARDRLAAAADRHALALGRRYRAITLRDPRSRWGSCSSEGRLMFSWRLAMAPPEILDYVAAHEVAHLVRMDHSPDFWAVVDDLCPNWRTRRDWLRAHGPGLHRYRFED